MTFVATRPKGKGRAGREFLRCADRRRSRLAPGGRRGAAWLSASCISPPTASGTARRASAPSAATRWGGCWRGKVPCQRLGRPGGRGRVRGGRHRDARRPGHRPGGHADRLAGPGPCRGAPAPSLRARLQLQLRARRWPAPPRSATGWRPSRARRASPLSPSPGRATGWAASTATCDDQKDAGRSGLALARLIAAIAVMRPKTRAGLPGAFHGRARDAPRDGGDPADAARPAQAGLPPGGDHGGRRRRGRAGQPPARCGAGRDGRRAAPHRGTRAPCDDRGEPRRRGGVAGVGQRQPRRPAGHGGPRRTPPTCRRTSGWWTTRWSWPART